MGRITPRFAGRRRRMTKKAVRWERLPRVLEEEKACGVQADKHFLLGWLQPHRLCRKHRVLVACSFSSRLLAIGNEMPDQVGHDADFREVFVSLRVL